GSTNFQLSFTVANLSKAASCGGHPLPPDLLFSVETPSGSVINSGRTGTLDFDFSSDIFSLYFRTPDAVTSVVVRIATANAGGCGNDFILDDIEIGACGPLVSAGMVVSPGNFNPFINRCVGDPSPVSLSASVGTGYLAPFYQWQFYNGLEWIDIGGAIAPDYSFTAPQATGTFKYRLSVAEAANISSHNCRVVSNEVTVSILQPTMHITAGSNSPVCENDTLRLSATGGLRYTWSGPGGFQTDGANPVVLATQGSGGDYMVTSADATGCVSADTTTVHVLPAPVITVSERQAICRGDSVALRASGGDAYNWQPALSLSDAASGEPVAKPAATTIYTVSVTDSRHCTDTAQVQVVVHEEPQVSAGADGITLAGQPVVLEGALADSNEVSYVWLPSSTLSNVHSLMPVATPAVTTQYVLRATSDIGCGSAEDTVLVTVYKELAIPTAFTPNGDGLNDVWNIPALRAFPKAVLSVYDRFGNTLFVSYGGKKGWDGTYCGVPQPAGAYPYFINLQNGSPVIKGDVVIIK
ncbi:MAG: T9SS type B sorting domain-containing protein, partial [Williamsia sp.]|nr:T9SS type B sorting domain-containing protein [Williamsia sp.]